MVTLDYWQHSIHGHRSVWKMPDGWSGPGNRDQNERAANVPDGLPYREGDFWCVPHPSATRGLHHRKRSVHWINRTATQFLKCNTFFIYFGDTFFVLTGHCCTVCAADHAVGSFCRCCCFLCVCSPRCFCPLKRPFHTRAFRFNSIQVCFERK